MATYQLQVYLLDKAGQNPTPENKAREISAPDSDLARRAARDRLTAAGMTIRTITLTANRSLRAYVYPPGVKPVQSKPQDGWIWRSPAAKKA